MRNTSRLVLAAILCVPAFLGAQSDGTSDRSTDINEVRRAQRRVANDAALEESLQAQALDFYDQAISLLETVAIREAEAAAFDKERSGIARMTRALEDSLKKAERSTRRLHPENPTSEQVEDALARERSRLAADRVRLRDIDGLTEERKASRNTISKRLGALDQELDLLSDTFRSVVLKNTHPEVKTAERFFINAQRDAARAEITRLRSSLALLDERGILIPLEMDLAQRRVFAGEQLVGLLEEKAHELKAKAADEALSRIMLQCDEVSEKVPELKTAAEETRKLAEQLLGSDGVVIKVEMNSQALSTTRKHHDDLGRIAELTHRKFAAFGRRGSITRWWPAIPADFPKTGAAKASIARLEYRVPEVEHQLITFEEQRARAREFAQQTAKLLTEAYGEDLDPEIDRIAMDLLGQRRDLLDHLVQYYSRYSNELVEHLAVSRYFSRELDQVERFLFAHILWSRSVPKPIIPRLTDLKSALLWVFGFGQGQGQTVDRPEDGGQSRFLPRDVVFGALLLLVVLFRKRLRLRLGGLAEKVRGPEEDSFRHTVDALVTTALLAAPVPLALCLLGSILRRGDTMIYFVSAAQALMYVAMVAGFLELTRQLFAPDGFTEAHLGWPSKVTRPIYEGLLWPQLVSLPLLFVALQLAMAGARFNSPAFLQVFNNSLGRLSFIAAITVSGLAILKNLRPELKAEEAPRPRAGKGQGRWARYAFPTAGIYAYPIVFISVVAPVALAVFGYYVTALLLSYQMLRMLWLMVGLLIFGGLLFRWYRISRRASADGDEADADGDHMAVGQVRQLFQFLVILVAAVGLFSIWSQALPMLEVLKRVQVFPHVMLIEESQGVLQAVPQGETSSREGSEAMAQDTPAESVESVTDAVDPTRKPDHTADRSRPLTLWALLQALLAAIITFTLVRNLPGLFEIVLRRRTRLDSGARIAFSTLVRYAITMVGAVVVSRFLGITWSSVQWLAAALTFGLGFGLQEIVANFVSGLILLAERPIRVGDVVTVGNLMGKVTQIQIRATTITLWDRSEMIVPNKEFITTKLVNWTLSDSKRRIEIPVRVTYGTDLELVKKTMVEVACAHPNVLDEPLPHVLLLNFGDDAVQLELRFVVEFGKGLATKDEVQMAIDKAFRENCIGFALPQLTVSLPDGVPSEESR